MAEKNIKVIALPTILLLNGNKTTSLKDQLRHKAIKNMDVSLGSR